MPPADPRPARCWLLTFALALPLYALTADRGPQWQDSGYQQLRIVTQQVEHPLGLALAHPLHHYLGRAAVAILPIEPAFAITLVSSLAAAIALANLAATLGLLTRSRAAAFIPALALGLSHTFWQHATITESYCLVAATLTGELLCLAIYTTTHRAGSLLALAGINSLGVANHLLSLLATPVFAVVILLAWRRRHIRMTGVLAAACLWLAGASPYLILIVRVALRSGDWPAAIHSALFGEYRSQVLNLRLNPSSLVRSAGYLFYNFPGLTLPLAVVAMFTATRDSAVYKRAGIALLVIYAAFALRYTIVDQYTYFIPVYVLLALLSGLVLARIAAPNPHSAFRKPNWILPAALVTACWTPLVYPAVAALFRSRGVLASQVGRKPYRDGYAALFIPWGVTHDHARRLNHDALALAGSSGLILLPDDMMIYALQYEQALGRVPKDVVIERFQESASPEVQAEQRKRVQGYLDAKRPVVLIPRDRDVPRTCLEDASWRRAGDLYRLESLSSPGENR